MGKARCKKNGRRKLLNKAVTMGVLPGIVAVPYVYSLNDIEKAEANTDTSAGVNVANGSSGSTSSKDLTKADKVYKINQYNNDLTSSNAKNYLWNKYTAIEKEVGTGVYLFDKYTVVDGKKGTLVQGDIEGSYNEYPIDGEKDGHYYIRKSEKTTTKWVRGSLVATGIKGPANMYPNNLKHTDGFIYVRNRVVPVFEWKQYGVKTGKVGNGIYYWDRYRVGSYQTSYSGTSTSGQLYLWDIYTDTGDLELKENLTMEGSFLIDNGLFDWDSVEGRGLGYRINGEGKFELTDEQGFFQFAMKYMLNGTVDEGISFYTVSKDGTKLYKFYDIDTKGTSNSLRDDSCKIAVYENKPTIVATETKVGSGFAVQSSGGSDGSGIDWDSVDGTGVSTKYEVDGEGNFSLVDDGGIADRALFTDYFLHGRMDKSFVFYEVSKDRKTLYKFYEVDTKGTVSAGGLDDDTFKYTAYSAAPSLITVETHSGTGSIMDDTSVDWDTIAGGRGESYKINKDGTFSILGDVRESITQYLLTGGIPENAVLYAVSKDGNLLYKFYDFDDKGTTFDNVGSGKEFVYDDDTFKYTVYKAAKPENGQKVGTVIGTYNAYNNNAVNSDGFKYVRAGKYNPQTFSNPTGTGNFTWAKYDAKVTYKRTWMAIGYQNWASQSLKNSFVAGKTFTAEYTSEEFASQSMHTASDGTIYKAVGDMEVVSRKGDLLLGVVKGGENDYIDNSVNPDGYFWVKGTEQSNTQFSYSGSYTTYYQGSYIDTVEGTYNEYINDQRNGNYWMVRGAERKVNAEVKGDLIGNVVDELDAHILFIKNPDGKFYERGANVTNISNNKADLVGSVYGLDGDFAEGELDEDGYIYSITNEFNSRPNSVSNLTYNGSNTIGDNGNLTWTAATDADNHNSMTYRVYQVIGEQEKELGVTKDTQFTVTVPQGVHGTQVKYKVIANDGSGYPNSDSEAAEVSAFAISTTSRPSDVGQVTINKTALDNISIQWQQSSDRDNNLDKYVVEYKLLDKDGVTKQGYTSLAEVQDIDYTHNLSGAILNGDNAYIQYRVKAVDTSSLESSWVESEKFQIVPILEEYEVIDSTHVKFIFDDGQEETVVLNSDLQNGDNVVNVEHAGITYTVNVKYSENPPSQVGTLDIRRTDRNTLDLSWSAANDADNNIEKYVLQYQVTDKNRTVTQRWKEVQSTNSLSASHSIDSIIDDHVNSYIEYRVRAEDAYGGTGSWKVSSPIQLKPLVNGVTVNSATRVTMTFDDNASEVVNLPERLINGNNSVTATHAGYTYVENVIYYSKVVGTEVIDREHVKVILEGGEIVVTLPNELQPGENTITFEHEGQQYTEVIEWYPDKQGYEVTDNGAKVKIKFEDGYEVVVDKALEVGVNEVEYEFGGKTFTENIVYKPDVTKVTIDNTGNGAGGSSGVDKDITVRIEFEDGKVVERTIDERDLEVGDNKVTVEINGVQYEIDVKYEPPIDNATVTYVKPDKVVVDFGDGRDYVVDVDVNQVDIGDNTVTVDINGVEYEIEFSYTPDVKNVTAIDANNIRVEFIGGKVKTVQVPTLSDGENNVQFDINGVQYQETVYYYPDIVGTSIINDTTVRVRFASGYEGDFTIDSLREGNNYRTITYAGKQYTLNLYKQPSRSSVADVKFNSETGELTVKLTDGRTKTQIIDVTTLKIGDNTVTVNIDGAEYQVDIKYTPSGEKVEYSHPGKITIEFNNGDKEHILLDKDTYEKVVIGSNEITVRIGGEDYKVEFEYKPNIRDVVAVDGDTIKVTYIDGTVKEYDVPLKNGDNTVKIIENGVEYVVDVKYNPDIKNVTVIDKDTIEVEFVNGDKIVVDVDDLKAGKNTVVINHGGKEYTVEIKYKPEVVKVEVIGNGKVKVEFENGEVKEVPIVSGSIVDGKGKIEIEVGGETYEIDIDTNKPNGLADKTANKADSSIVDIKYSEGIKNVTVIDKNTVEIEFTNGEKIKVKLSDLKIGDNRVTIKYGGKDYTLMIKYKPEIVKVTDIGNGKIRLEFENREVKDITIGSGSLTGGKGKLVVTINGIDYEVDIDTSKPNGLADINGNGAIVDIKYSDGIKDVKVVGKDTVEITFNNGEKITVKLSDLKIGDNRINITHGGKEYTITVKYKPEVISVTDIGNGKIRLEFENGEVKDITIGSGSLIGGKGKLIVTIGGIQYEIDIDTSKPNGLSDGTSINNTGGGLKNVTDVKYSEGIRNVTVIDKNTLDVLFNTGERVRVYIDDLKAGQNLRTIRHNGKDYMVIINYKPEVKKVTDLGNGKLRIEFENGETKDVAITSGNLIDGKGKIILDVGGEVVYEIDIDTKKPNGLADSGGTNSGSSTGLKNVTDVKYSEGIKGVTVIDKKTIDVTFTTGEKVRITVDELKAGENIRVIRHNGKDYVVIIKYKPEVKKVTDIGNGKLRIEFENGETKEVSITSGKLIDGKGRIILDIGGVVYEIDVDTKKPNGLADKTGTQSGTQSGTSSGTQSGTSNGTQSGTSSGSGTSNGSGTSGGLGTATDKVISNTEKNVASNLGTSSTTDKLGITSLGTGSLKGNSGSTSKTSETTTPLKASNKAGVPYTLKLYNTDKDISSTADNKTYHKFLEIEKVGDKGEVTVYKDGKVVAFKDSAVLKESGTYKIVSKVGSKKKTVEFDLDIEEIYLKIKEPNKKEFTAERFKSYRVAKGTTITAVKTSGYKTSRMYYNGDYIGFKNKLDKVGTYKIVAVDVWGNAIARTIVVK